MPKDNPIKNQEELGKINQFWKIFPPGAFSISSKTRNQGYVFVIFLFSLTFFLGITTSLKSKEILKLQGLNLQVISFWQFLLYFILTTLIILSISYFQKFKKEREAIFKIIFIVAVFSGGFISLSLLVGYIVSLALIVVLIFLWLKKPTVLVHDLLVILGIGGAAGILGLRFEPKILILLLIILSLYDFIAVYKTKHMVKMAQEMIKAEAMLALIVPQKISDFGKKIKEIKPGGNFFFLGGGDVAFPLLLSVSLLSGGVLYSLIIAFFALMGLFAGFYFFIDQKQRQPIPALPPIALSSIIGFLITLII